MKSKPSISFILAVILPILIAAIYYTFFASGQYVVTTKYIIQGHKPAQSAVLGAFAGLTGASASPSAKDSYIAQEYIWSAELLDKLDKEINIKEHYTDTQHDWWARLPKDAIFSDYQEYWQDMVDIEYDATSSITTVEVTAFTAVKAYIITTELIKEAESHVNKLYERSKTDSLNFAKGELTDAENALLQARENITTFRNTQKDIDPEKTTEAKLGIVTELEIKLTEAQAELSNLAAFMKPDTFKIRILKNKVTTLKKQIYAERKRWGSTKDNQNTLSTRIASYERLLTKKMVAEKLYESSLSSLETARLNAMQQQQYLEVITAPYQPSEAEKPYVLKQMTSVILGSFLIWAIGVLIISSVRDHT